MVVVTKGVYHDTNISNNINGLAGEAEPIDNQLIGDNTSQITTLSNGCIYCNRSNKLENTLLDLLAGFDNKQLVFDHLIIECTGMADPGSIM